MTKNNIKLIEECIDFCKINYISKNESEITIQIPKKMKNIWLIKLSDLTTTLDEIKDFENKAEKNYKNS